MTAAWRRIAVDLLPSWLLVPIAAQACSPAWPEVVIFSVVSILATLWLFVRLHRLLQADATAKDTAQPIRASSLLGGVLVVAILIVAFADATGPRHDYRAYLKQWQIVLAGLDPWLNTNNAYGPLFSVVLVVTLLAQLGADDFRLPGCTGAVPASDGLDDRGTQQS